jgi:pimeloyl-ACP methyl ester carboxylesterase
VHRVANHTMVDVDGGEVEAIAVGPADGEPMLLIPGGPGEARAWRYTFPEVDGGPAGHHGLHLATFDRRGVGGSAHTEPCGSSALNADDAVAVGRALLGERFHVVGISVGGMVAMQAALRHPDQVASLVLVATSAGGQARTPPDQRYIDNVMSPPEDPDVALRENLAIALSPGWPAEHPGRFDQLVADMAASPQVSDAANAALFELFVTHDATDLLSAIAAPTLVIGCEHDLVVPVANAEYLADAIPGARLARVPSGHAIDVEAGDRLVELIREHVTSHPTT